MSDSGKAGSGRGNNRRRPFRRRGGGAQDGHTPGSSPGGSSDSSGSKNENASQWGRAEERKTHGRGHASGLSENQQKTGKKGQDDNQGRQGRGVSSRRSGDYPRKEPAVDRPKWAPPKLNTDPLPAPDCSYCGKPIRDLASAMTDRISGTPVHFDCVAQKISGEEKLEKGDTITYIGGGRFGIVNFGGSGEGAKYHQAGPSSRTHGDASRSKTGGYEFKIKKIIEWESNEKRADWRSEICDHYSVT